MTKIPSEQFVRQIIERGESYVAAQLTLATSADQRASSMAGIFAAAGTAVIGGIFAASSTTFGSFYWPLVFGAAATAVAFLTASALCGFSVHPVGFYLPGTQPKNWTSDIEKELPESESLFGLTKNIQEKIEKNRSTLAKNAGRFKWGLRSGIFAPWAGLVVFAGLVVVEHLCSVAGRG